MEDIDRRMTISEGLFSIASQKSWQGAPIDVSSLLYLYDTLDK